MVSGHNGFQRMRDGGTVDLVAHMSEVLSRHADVEVLVGCDSRNRAHHTVYATVVVLRFHRNGAQVVYRPKRHPRSRTFGHGFGAKWKRAWRGGPAASRGQPDPRAAHRHGPEQ